MTTTSRMLALLMWLVTVPGMAQAAILQTFSSRADLMAAAPAVTSTKLTSGVIAPVSFPALLTAGPLTVTAVDGLLAENGLVLSSELDQDELVLSFDRPLLGLGLKGGVVDEAFDFISGAIDVSVVGSGVAQLVGSAGGSAFLGFISDVPFQEVRLTVNSFDTGASSVAFVGLAEAVDVVTPLPPAIILLASALMIPALPAALRRHRRPTI